VERLKVPRVGRKEVPTLSYFQKEERLDYNVLKEIRLDGSREILRFWLFGFEGKKC
jgi:hypothetical protein